MHFLAVSVDTGWLKLLEPPGLSRFAAGSGHHQVKSPPTDPMLFVSQVIRSRTRQNFELVHIIGPVQNFGPPARNFGPPRAEFTWREWRKTLGGHAANWAGLSVFSPRENKISHTFFIDCINKYSKVSNAHNSDDCHGVFNGGMLNKGWTKISGRGPKHCSRSKFQCCPRPGHRRSVSNSFLKHYIEDKCINGSWKRVHYAVEHIIMCIWPGLGYSYSVLVVLEYCISGTRTRELPSDSTRTRGQVLRYSDEYWPEYWYFFYTIWEWKCSISTPVEWGNTDW